MWQLWLKFLNGTLWPMFCFLDITHYTIEFPHAWGIGAAFGISKVTESDSDKEDDDSDMKDNSKQKPVAPVVQGGQSLGLQISCSS